MAAMCCLLHQVHAGVGAGFDGFDAWVADRDRYYLGLQATRWITVE